MEYLKANLAIWENNCIHLPDSQPIPNDGTNRGLKHGIDSWHTAHSQHTPPALSLTSLAHGPPPHLDARIATTSCIEEVTETRILQVSEAAPLNPDDDLDDNPVNIFEVLMTTRKQCKAKAAQIPELV
jgi:hypothetical protein